MEHYIPRSLMIYFPFDEQELPATPPVPSQPPAWLLARSNIASPPPRPASARLAASISPSGSPRPSQLHNPILQQRTWPEGKSSRLLFVIGSTWLDARTGVFVPLIFHLQYSIRYLSWERVRLRLFPENAKTGRVPGYYINLVLG